MHQARLLVQSANVADGLVQETLRTVFLLYEEHRDDDSLEPWAMNVLRNNVVQWYRAPVNRVALHAQRGGQDMQMAIDKLYDSDGTYLARVPPWQPPANRHEQRLLLTTLEHCVDSLPEQAGRVLLMREWLSFDTNEIGERLGMSAGNCRTILYRARASLRDCVQKGWLEQRIPA
jgi:RNA polymerase sigma-70 factor (ECF subfamily)